MAKTPPENGIFTKEFILDIVMKLLGFFFIVGVVLVMLLIGLSIGEISLNFGPVAIRFSTPEPKEGAAPNDIFFDDFSNPKSGWDSSESEDGSTKYENGAYRIKIYTIGESGNGISYWSSPTLKEPLPADVQIETDARKIGGPDDNDFGVICRYTSINNVDRYYQFLASSDGFAGILLVNGDEQKIISAEKLETSDAIQQGEENNHIRADCVGDKLTLFINGTQVASAVDDTLTQGEAGLIAGTYSTPGTDISFDNFLIKKR